MVLDIYSDKKSSFIEFPEYLSNIYSEYELKCPICDKVETYFYDDVQLNKAEVVAFKIELEMILAKYIDTTLNTKKVRARSCVVLDQIKKAIFDCDPVYIKLLELIAVCDDAILRNSGIVSCSD